MEGSWRAAPNATEYAWMHSALSSQTGANVGPSRCQRPEGMGFFRQALPAGVVPNHVSQPRAAGS